MKDEDCEEFSDVFDIESVYNSDILSEWHDQISHHNYHDDAGQYLPDTD